MDSCFDPRGLTGLKKKHTLRLQLREEELSGMLKRERYRERERVGKKQPTITIRNKKYREKEGIDFWPTFSDTIQLSLLYRFHLSL